MTRPTCEHLLPATSTVLDTYKQQPNLLRHLVRPSVIKKTLLQICRSHHLYVQQVICLAAGSCSWPRASQLVRAHRRLFSSLSEKEKTFFLSLLPSTSRYSAPFSRRYCRCARLAVEVDWSSAAAALVAKLARVHQLSCCEIAICAARKLQLTKRITQNATPTITNDCRQNNLRPQLETYHVFDSNLTTTTTTNTILTVAIFARQHPI